MHLEMNPPSLEHVWHQLAILRNALKIRDIIEPVPQYLADALCKSQRTLLHALVTGIHNDLRQQWDNTLVNLWLGKWRTG